VLNKNFLVQQLHRRDLRGLISRADAVFTSTASQAEHLRALCPECAVEVLPVGTNIVPGAGGCETRQAGTAVVFGLQGSRIHALEKMHAGLKAAAAAGCIQSVVVVGGGANADQSRREQELLTTLRLRGGLEQRGSLPEQEVSALLSQAGFGVSAQDQLSVTKSGTFMAYAAHGMNILSPFANAGDEPLRWATDPGELVRGIADVELQSRAESLRNWQERTCSWPRIAEQFARTLRLDVQPAVTAHSL
jgi:hypothetical protein